MKPRKGFTLIELLVVIAIIGLLLAILVPGLLKAKQYARTLICKTHLKGLGTAILVYLEGNDDRAYPHGEDLGLGDNAGNEFRWVNEHTGERIDPRDPEAYWGVAYADYAETPEVFGCPEFIHVGSLIYDDMDAEMSRQAGYGLNEYFGRDDDQPLLGRKTSSIFNPGRFIITHDHVEPGVEQGSRDMFHNDGPGTLNLTHFRQGGGRSEHYWGIFRHNKRNASLDDQSQASTRIPQIDDNPNGLANVLFLDGRVDAIRETTGDNVPETSYTGTLN